jgi:hypothetical protein
MGPNSRIGNDRRSREVAVHHITNRVARRDSRGEKALKSGGNKDCTMKQPPNLIHLFQTCRTGNIDEYGRIEETFAPSAL